MQPSCVHNYQEFSQNYLCNRCGFSVLKPPSCLEHNFQEFSNHFVCKVCGFLVHKNTNNSTNLSSFVSTSIKPKSVSPPSSTGNKPGEQAQTSSLSSPKKATNEILTCRNCGLQYRANKNDDKACVYHPKVFNGSRWSCCREFKTHTGCNVGKHES